MPLFCIVCSNFENSFSARVCHNVSFIFNSGLGREPAGDLCQKYLNLTWVSLPFTVFSKAKCPCFSWTYSGKLPFFYFLQNHGLPVERAYGKLFMFGVIFEVKYPQRQIHSCRETVWLSDEGRSQYIKNNHFLLHDDEVLC